MKESLIQARLITRCHAAAARYPEMEWVYSYPAGLTLGYRREEGKAFSPQALKAKAMGLKKALPDIILDVSRGEYRKGWIELKKPGEKPRKDQLEMHEKLRGKGDWVAWSDDLEEAWALICGYMGVPLDCWKMLELPVVESFEQLGGKTR